MTYDPNMDRSYWRGQSAERLVEAGKDSGHELAIALAERLEDKDARLDDLRELDRRGWGRTEDEYLATISVMRSEIAALEDQVAGLLGLKGD